MIDWTINLGNMISIGAVLVMVGKFYADNRRAGADISDIKADIKSLNAVVTQVALQNQRLDNQGTQLAQVRQEISELRRGEGLITQHAAR